MERRIDMGVLALIGAAAIVVGGLLVACSSLEAANERKKPEPLYYCEE